MEVFENFQRRGYAGSILKSLIVFLLQNDIDDIFLIPGIAGSLENLSPTALDIYQLEWFYLKRGFREMPKTGYWKLDKGIFLNFIKEDVIDFELLKIDYIPSTPDYAIEKSFKRKLESMPVKMMIHRRA